MTMRTTIEIPNDLRVRLVEEAARAGYRGFSPIIEEALRAYFAGQPRFPSREEQVSALYGVERDENLPVDSRTRGSWRTGKDEVAEQPLGGWDAEDPAGL